MLASFIGLIASVKENSIVFIDEPEVSLHPNWQMQYMFNLKKLFSGYKSCHFVIATHSHFIISDTTKSNSQIIGLKKEKNITPVHFENYDTYGWSAEDVLFRVFNVKSTRNHYFEMAVAELLDLLYSKSKDKEKINFILKELKALKISDNDPLKELIEETEDYLNV